MTIQEDLRQGLLFARLSEEALSRTARRAMRIQVNEGQCLFRQGDTADRFYLVLRGLIKLFRLSPSGNEKVIEIVMPGSTFAEALMFLDHPHYPVGAEALSPAEVISVDANDFSDMLKDSVDTCFLLLGDMSQRLRGLLREIDNLSLHSATCRVAAYLLQIAPAGADTFRLPIAKQVLASRLSVKPETLSRIIKQLSSTAVISVHGGQVTILDRAKLEHTADVCALPPDSLQGGSGFPCATAAPEKT